MTPAEALEKHTAVQCCEASSCRECGCTWPCDTFTLACWAEEQSAASAKLVSDLVEQRDALL